MVTEKLESFSRKDLLEDPVRQFALWYEQALAQEPFDVSAMTLATVDKNYHVSARMVLLKEFSADGFVFFTNYDSPKAKALEVIPQAALVFWWPACQRQVRINGSVSKISPERSEEYFRSRPFESQIAAIVSKQSHEIPSRESLVERYEAATEQPIVYPANWGGYNIEPSQFEFWQGRPHRLHDRFLYYQENGNWKIMQLAP